ncbi:Nebulette [Tupaia chinensis]|uniref:Nebulette n=1 Tax=Tupaia chinensis TaxID=246437 RepID=L9LCG9_TUPCH|nr:Nebulette [Tupaia chinensis]
MRVPVFEDIQDETTEGNMEEGENEEDQVFPKPVIEDLSMELARKCTALISDIHYKEEYKKSKDKCTFVTDTPMLNHVKNIGAFISEAKYKGTSKANLSNSLYKRMPATIDSVFAREVTQLQSEVAYKQKHDAAKGFSDYAHMMEPPEVKHAMEVNKYQSNAEYKKGQGIMHKEPAVIGRPDFEHAVEASKLSSQIKYREKFDNEMKDKKHHYNPLESASFRQNQLAATLASNREYKKLFEENKGMYHFDADAAEHLHHKGNATLQSQVKYKEDYEKNKGKSLLEFVETPSYQASKEAQKMQSEKVYREDFEKEIKGRSSLDLDKTPEFLHVKYITNLLREKEYKKDLENEIKGKGMELNSEVLDIQRVKRASEMASEKDYKKDLETEIKGKGMQVSIDTLDVQRAKKASEMASQKQYKKDLENEIKGKGMQVSVDIPDMLRAKRASEIYSQLQYKEQNYKATPVKYHEDFEKTKGRGFTPVVDDPVTERVRKNTQVVSDAAYKGVHPHIVEMDRRPGIIVGECMGFLRYFTCFSFCLEHKRVWECDGEWKTDALFKTDSFSFLTCELSHLAVEESYRDDLVLPSLTESKRLNGVQLHPPSLGCAYSTLSQAMPWEEFRLQEETPVLPGAYQQGHSQGYGYMHQTSASSMRSMQHSPNLRTYRAMYDYSAQDEDEVSFRDGDYIVNVQPIDDGWMYGTVQRTGRTGMLPANYIEFVN